MAEMIIVIAWGKPTSDIISIASVGSILIYGFKSIGDSNEPSPLINETTKVRRTSTAPNPKFVSKTTKELTKRARSSMNVLKRDTTQSNMTYPPKIILRQAITVPNKRHARMKDQM